MEKSMEPKPKRIKIDVACEACRRRKVKCDGVRPACGNCWKRTDLRTGCFYSSESEKPHSKEKTTDSSPSVHTPDIRARPKSLPAAPDTSFTHVSLPPPNATPKSTTSSSGPEPTRRDRRMDRPYPITPSDASPSVVDSMTTVREDGTVTGEYFGSSSAGSFTNQIKAAIDARFGSATESCRGGPRSCALFKPVASLPPHDSNSSSSTGPGGHHQPDYVLPARKQADHLLDLYWYYVDPLYPFLDRQRFERSYHALFAGTALDADERIFVSILNIIMALSTQLIESMLPDQRDASSQAYFSRAQDLLQLSLWDTGSIELLQCLLIMSQYLQSTNNPHQTWMVVGSCVRIAQGLGLHLPETATEGLASESERDLVRRVWQGCILMDRMIAITHGRPAMISDHLASSVILPRIPEASEQGDNGLSHVHMRRLRYQGFFVKSLELYEIINQAVLTLYTSTTTSGLKSPTTSNHHHHLGQSVPDRHEGDLGTALQLDQRLARWEKSLPGFLTMAEPETPLDEVFRRQAVILRIRLLHARMLLLRPMLARFCLSQSSTDSSCHQKTCCQQQQHDDLSSRVTQQGAMVCVEAAQSLIFVIVRFQTHDGTLGLLPAWWYRVFYIYTAATVLVAARLRPAVFSSLDISRSWNQGMALLRDHEALGQSPRRCAAALQILSTKMFQDQQQQHAQSLQSGLPPTSTSTSTSSSDQETSNTTVAPAPTTTIAGEQDLFDMPFPYLLGQDAAFDIDAISFDVNDFSWLNSMPGSL